MATIRIGTFNTENLFTRYTFKKTIDSQNDSGDIILIVRKPLWSGTSLPYTERTSGERFNQLYKLLIAGWPP